MAEKEIKSAPYYIKNSFNHIKVNDEFNRVVYAHAYPRLVREGWMNSLILADGDFDISFYINPTSLEVVLANLNKELIKQESDMLAAESKGLVNPLLKVQYNDTYKTLEKLQKGEEKLFDLGFYANIRAKTKEKLELLTRKVINNLNSILVIPKIPIFRMQQALQSVFPTFNDKLRIYRNIPSNALAACFPFTSSFLKIDPDGVLLGLNKDNNIPIIMDVYKLPNYNGLVLGTSGGGKSYAVKLYILRNFMKGVKTIVIDPQGEYSSLIKDLKGQIIEMSRESETMLNPFDLMSGDFGEKLLSLGELLGLMLGQLNEEQKNILDKAVLEIYEDKGIVANDNSTWKKKPPIMEDLFNIIVRERKSAVQSEKIHYVSLENRIRVYVKGSFSFMNKQTNLDLAKDTISFNIENMPKPVKPILMFLILDFIIKRMRKDKGRKLLVVDEAWSLLRHGQQADYLFEIVKTSRKFGLGIAIITQEVDDLLTTEAGHTILANTSWKMLMRQDAAVIKALSDKFNLNPEEQSQLLSSSIGEGMLFAYNEHIPLRIVASEKEHELITTNPDELRLQGKERKVK